MACLLGVEAMDFQRLEAWTLPLTSKFFFEMGTQLFTNKPREHGKEKERNAETPGILQQIFMLF